MSDFRQRFLVYLAGPITVPNPMLNTQRAILEADRLIEAGFAVIVPHLSVLWEAVSPKAKSHDEWLDLDFNYIARCDALVRLSGESRGSDREVAFAREQEIPVYFSVDDFLDAPILRRGVLAK